MSLTGTEFLAVAAFAYFLLSNRVSYSQIAPNKNINWSRGLTEYPALLSEYYPNTPVSASQKVKRREGGAHDKKGNDLITIQQHRGNNLQYPYISVSSDLIIDGVAVPYGARLYIKDFPNDVFRIVDTGDNFRWDKNKQIHVPGHEPFDIATDWHDKGKLAGKRTWYAIDMSDNLLRKRTPTT